MKINAENVEKLDVGNHSGALLAKGLLIDCINAGDALEEKVSDLEKRNAQLLQQLHETKNKLACIMETTQTKWHQCEHPNSEGFYDLPPESGEYIVQVRARNGRPETFATDFDADYSDWPELINGTVVIQWCEEPKLIQPKFDKPGEKAYIVHNKQSTE